MVDAGIKGLHHPPGDRPARDREQDLVEVRGSLQHAARRSRCKSRLDRVVGGLQVFDVALGSHLRGPPRRLGLQQGPDFVNLRCLADIGPDHCRPLLRQRLDQAFRFEVAQHLAHYRATDAKEIAQCPLDKPFTGLEAEVQDRVTELLQREFTQSPGAAVYPQISYVHRCRGHVGSDPTTPLARNALIHTLRFGNNFRKTVGATSYLSFINTRGGPNCPVVIPLMHKADEGMRSHYLTVQFSILDAPGPDEIVVALGASIGGRPHHRIGDRYQDIAELGRTDV